MLCPINSPFFPVWSALRHSQYWNWPSLVFTARSPIIPWIFWSHKPSHKHDSNKYQSKAFCNLRPQFWWDQICDARKQSIPGLIVVSIAKLSTLPAPHQSEAAFVGEWVFQNRGVCGQACPSFPSPVIPFFCSRLDVLDELARKRLLCTLALFGNSQGIFTRQPKMAHELLSS